MRDHELMCELTAHADVQAAAVFRPDLTVGCSVPHVSTLAWRAPKSRVLSVANLIIRAIVLRVARDDFSLA